MADCNIEEIIKQLEYLNGLKQIRNNINNGNGLGDRYPELADMGSRLDMIIAEQEIDLKDIMDECGKIDLPVSDLPDMSFIGGEEV